MTGWLKKFCYKGTTYCKFLRGCEKETSVVVMH